MLDNRSMPSCTVIPELDYDDLAEAVGWLCAAFGLTERWRAAGHCERARTGGARIVSQPADFPYGERQYTAADLGGHLWTFSQSIVDVAPEEWGGTSASPDQQSRPPES